MEVKDLDEVTAITTMKWRLRNSKFTYSLNKILLRSYVKLFERT